MSKSYIIFLILYFSIISYCLNKNSVLFLSVIITIIGLFYHQLIIKKNEKEYFKTFEAVQFMNLTSHALYFKNQDKLIFDEAFNQITNVEKLELKNRNLTEENFSILEAYFQFKPFSLYKQIVFDEGLNLKKARIIKVIKEYGESFVDIEGRGDKKKQIKNITINTIELSSLILLMHRIYIIPFGLETNIIINTAYITFFLMMFFLWLIEYYLLFINKNKSPLINTFLIEYLLYIQFETPYTSYEHALTILPSKEEKNMQSLKKSFANGSFEPILSLYNQYEDPVIKECLLLLYRASYTNVIKKEELELSKELLNKLVIKNNAIDVSSIEMLKKSFFILVIFIQMYFLISYGV